jgi:hypothetical protein
MLLADIPGRDGWDASPETVADAVRRLSVAQARIDRPPHGLPDRRPEVLAAAVGDLLDGSVGAELSPAELRAARGLQVRWEMLAGCGLPDTVVHGDFHAGNWRCGDGPQVVLDFADAHLGNPYSTRSAPSTTCRQIAAAPRLTPGSTPGPQPHPDHDRPTPADRRTARPLRLGRPVPGVPQQHRTHRTRLPPRRPGRRHPPRARKNPSARAISEKPSNSLAHPHMPPLARDARSCRRAHGTRDHAAERAERVTMPPSARNA